MKPVMVVALETSRISVVIQSVLLAVGDQERHNVL